jgi:hypothetical protein
MSNYRSATVVAFIWLMVAHFGCAGTAHVDGTNTTRWQPQLDGTVVTSSGADDVFKDRRLFPLDLARPDDLPGSIVYMTKSDAGRREWYYEPLTTHKPRLEKDERKLFQAIVDQKFLAGATVTMFVSLSSTMGLEDKAELLIQDLYSLSGPEKADVQPKIDAWVEASKGLKPIEAFYCRATRVSTAVSEVYRKISGGGKISGPVFGVNGDYYSATSLYTARSFITWDPVPVPLPGGRGNGELSLPPLEINAIKRRLP